MVHYEKLFEVSSNLSTTVCVYIPSPGKVETGRDCWDILVSHLSLHSPDLVKDPVMKHKAESI